MGQYVKLICEPEPSNQNYLESDVKLILAEVAALDALADEIGVRALGEFGLGESDDEDWDSVALFNPKEAIESIDGLVAALREPPPPPKGKRRRLPASSDFIYERAVIIEELEELGRRLKLVSRGKTRFRFVTVD